MYLCTHLCCYLHVYFSLLETVKHPKIFVYFSWHKKERVHKVDGIHCGHKKTNRNSNGGNPSKLGNQHYRTHQMMYSVKIKMKLNKKGQQKLSRFQCNKNHVKEIVLKTCRSKYGRQDRFMKCRIPWTVMTPKKRNDKY